MNIKKARADVAHIRQTTQFTCCAASIASALRALGKNVTEDDVNRVLGAQPMRGASWEQMLATVQYFGCRGALVVPATPSMLKSWTDRGNPAVIAWNPEDRPWSHASVVFDVVSRPDGILDVHIMDPNIPNPSRTVRVMGEDAFCQKWGEKMSDTMILRRPAMLVSLEVTPGGRQVVASERTSGDREVTQVGNLKAYWEYNSGSRREYVISDRSIEGNPIIGQIAWNRKSNTWEVSQWLDNNQERKRSLGTLTASDAREGVKLSLMLFQEKQQNLVLASTIPIPKLVKSPRPYKNGADLKKAWSEVVDMFMSKDHEYDTDDQDVILRDLGPFDAGYKAGLARETSGGENMRVGGLFLSLAKMNGHYEHSLQEWKLGYEAGLEQAVSDEGHKVAKRTTEVRGPKRDPNKIVIPDDAVRRTPRLGPEAVTTRRKTRFDDKTVYDRKPKRRESYE